MLRTDHKNPPASLEFAHQAQLNFRQRPFAPVIRRRALLWLVLLVSIAGLIPLPVFAQGIITTVAGNGERGLGNDGLSPLNLAPYTGGVAVDAAGNFYI